MPPDLWVPALGQEGVIVAADSVAAAPNDGLLRLRYGQALGQATLFNAAYEQFHAARASS